MPKVSVIMPNYNRSWIIMRAINSVLNQTFDDLELVIIDDGSTDDSISLVESIKDPKIILLKEPHRGVAATRNTGLKKSTGSLISYLDTDNSWYPNFLEVMVDNLSSVDVMCYCGQNLLLCKGDKTNYKVIGRQVRSKEFNPVKLIQDNFIDMNCVLHRRLLLDKCGYFDETLSMNADWDMFARFAVEYPFGIKHVDSVLSDYYSFLKGTEETITNSNMTDEKLLSHYKGLKKPEGEKLIIYPKIARLLDAKYPMDIEA